MISQRKAFLYPVLLFLFVGLMSCSGGGSSSKTVYEPGRKTIAQTYTPLYLQEAMADYTNYSQRNRQKSREQYLDAVGKASIMPGAGLPQTDPKTHEREQFDMRKFLPSEEFLAKGYEDIENEAKEKEEEKPVQQTPKPMQGPFGTFPKKGQNFSRCAKTA